MEQLHPDEVTLREMLQAARARTLAFASRLRPDQWLGPYLSIVNPPLWEIGHLAWFQEHWCLRYRPDRSLGPSMLQNADACYNSAIVPHAQRWHLPLINVEQTLTYLRDVLNAVLSRIEREGITEHLRYFALLAVFHEEMHNEAFHYTCQTLRYPSEKRHKKQTVKYDPPAGDANIAGGRFLLGAGANDGFVFDNEKWAHEVTVQPYRMARTAVSNAEFAGFVDDEGYMRREQWSEAGWHWRTKAGATTPVYWVKQGTQWHVRCFDKIVPLAPNAAVLHVNWYEAEAYCNWAKRRLPTEAEWEAAASAGREGCIYPTGIDIERSQANFFSSDTTAVMSYPPNAFGLYDMAGNVYEWCQDWYAYNYYDASLLEPMNPLGPPQGVYRVLRGGCWKSLKEDLRSSHRHRNNPGAVNGTYGFRCASDVSI